MKIQSFNKLTFKIWTIREAPNYVRIYQTLCIMCISLEETLQWRHYEHDGVSNHQPRDCLLKRLFKAQIKENIKAPRHWPLCVEFTGDRWIPRTNGQ